MFGFFKKNSSSSNSTSGNTPDYYGPTDPADRPLSWFLSSEGEKSFRYYAALDNDFDTSTRFMRMVQKRDFYHIATNILIDRQHSILSFAYYYAQALTGGSPDLQWGRISDRALVYSLNSIFNIMIDNVDWNLPYEKIISVDNNPPLKFFIKFRFPAKVFIASDVKDQAHMVLTDYIERTYKKGRIDASKETWIYDGSLFNYFDSISRLAYAVTIYAEHPEYIRDYIREAADTY